MKPAIIMVLAPVLALALSSCATRDDSDFSNVPGYYAGDQALNQGPNTGAEKDRARRASLAPTVGATGSGWPRVCTTNGLTTVVFQPQIDSWDGRSLTGRCAVAIKSPDRPLPIYGVIAFDARTLVDKAERLVTMDHIKIVTSEFPSAPEKATGYTAMLSRTMQQQLKSISLDSLEATFTSSEAQKKPRTQTLRNVPPKIIVSERPALLVSIDGPPAYRPVSGTGL